MAGDTNDSALAERMRQLGIREEDLEESFIRSGGKGGQNVNKVATCVVLRHLPTGTLIKCQEERSQALNRHRARVLLADKIESERRARALAAADMAARERRRKRRRSAASKQRMLDQKRARAAIKSTRSRVRPDHD